MNFVRTEIGDIRDALVSAVRFRYLASRSEAFYGVGTAMAIGDQPNEFAIKFQRDQTSGDL